MVCCDLKSPRANSEEYDEAAQAQAIGRDFAALRPARPQTLATIITCLKELD